jgi:hypothetical protein
VLRQMVLVQQFELGVEEVALLYWSAVGDVGG